MFVKLQLKELKKIAVEVVADSIMLTSGLIIGYYIRVMMF